MKGLLTILILSVALTTPVIKKEFVEYLRQNVPWKVADPDKNKFRDWTMEEIKHIMGTKSSRTKDYHKPLRTGRVKRGDLKKRTGRSLQMDEYDFRMMFPECALPPRDIQNCGGSWSFATVIPLEQRFCMYTMQPHPLSVQDPLSCSTENDGCDGGYLDETWGYFESTGVVDEDCFPYSSGQGEVEPCIDKCKNGAEFKKYNASDIWDFWMEDDIIDELTYNGPISSSMEVYEDFLDYAGGTPYFHFGGEYVGTIGVIIIGYGYDFDDNYYWIMQNNWGEEWGEFGYFKIYFGEARCDQMTVAGQPVLEGVQRKK